MKRTRLTVVALTLAVLVGLTWLAYGQTRSKWVDAPGDQGYMVFYDEGTSITNIKFGPGGIAILNVTGVTQNAQSWQSGGTVLGVLTVTNVGGNVTFTGNETFSGTHTLNAGSTVRGILTVTNITGATYTGAGTFGAGATVHAVLTVTNVAGNATFTGNETFNGTMALNGNTTIRGLTTITNATVHTATVTRVNGTTYGVMATAWEGSFLTTNINSDAAALDIVGAPTMRSGATVLGVLTATNVGGNATFTGNLSQNGTVTILDTLTARGVPVITNLNGFSALNLPTSAGAAGTLWNSNNFICVAP